MKAQNYRYWIILSWTSLERIWSREDSQKLKAFKGMLFKERQGYHLWGMV